MIVVSGCFDGLHAGHIRYLQAAHAIDPTLPMTVLVADDAYIRHWKKREPRWCVQDRAYAVGSIVGVDDVQIHGWQGIADDVKRLKPQFLVKGADWRGQLDPAITAQCLIAGTELVYTPIVGVHGAGVW